MSLGISSYSVLREVIMCSRKTFNKRRTHVAPVHAEFMSCESTRVEELLLSYCKHRHNSVWSRMWGKRQQQQQRRIICIHLLGILSKSWYVHDASSIHNFLTAGLMEKGASLPRIIIYGVKQIPLNICDQPQIPMRNIGGMPVHEIIKPSIVCILNPCSEQPRVFSAVHQRGCFPYWDKKLNLQEQRMLGLLQGGEAVALIMEPTPIAQAMRQTAVAPAQPCLWERIANSVTLQKLTLPLSLCLCENMWLNRHVTERGGKDGDAVNLHCSVTPYMMQKREREWYNWRVRLSV